MKRRKRESEQGREVVPPRGSVSSATRREFLAGAGLSLCAGRSGLSQAAAAELERGFLSPPANYKPWVYWWWLNGNVTEKSITRDLEEMKKKGVGGFLMFDSRAYGEHILPPPPAPNEYMSDDWRRLWRFAISEASRLGLEMSANLSTHGGTLRSPWETGEDAPKKLAWTSAYVRGGRKVTAEVRRPAKGHFWDVALVAVRRDETAGSAGEPNLNGEWHDITPEAKGAPVPLVLDLTQRIDNAGALTWDAPEGPWTLIRFACVTMSGFEKDVDILNAKAAENHFNRMGRRFLEDAGPLAGKTLTHLYNVSWEGSSPTWTPGFERDFAHFRGYSPIPYLPVLAGVTVDSREASGRFMEDFGRTLSDCFLTRCYAKLGGLCHKAGLKWHSESGGPWDRKKPLFQYADQLAFWGRNDAPQGEFWHQGANHTNCRRTAMAARIYGREKAIAEAFTNMVQHWSEYPGLIKPRGDAAFIDGINHFIWHTFDASPEEFGKPGIVYFAGSHLNPNVTWWMHADAVLAWLGRCQFLLRQGRFVSDVCVYTSDRNYAGWGRDERWSENASLELGKGYTYDLVNTEVLVERLSVRDGALVLPEGMSYRVLVADLTEEVLPPEALRKIVALAEAGATVILGRRRPVRAPGLKDAGVRDAEVLRLAAQLWGESGGGASRRGLGRGKLITGSSLDDVLKAEGILPDFSGPFEYNHRRSEEAEIYFVTGQGAADCAFRVSGKAPELWDPVSGRILEGLPYRTSGDGRTVVSLSLPENGSVFVVFRKAAEGRHLRSAAGPADGWEITGRTERGLDVRLWKQGRYEFQSGNKSKRLKANPTGMVLTGAWEVRFAPGWGAPESAVFERLIPWNEHPQDGIKFFSGTAVYRKRFRLTEGQARRPIRLQLGQVKHLAQVKLNGQATGVLWTSPWCVDLTGKAKAGDNELEIEVTNTWANRLIGDASLPEAKRLTKTIVRRPPDFSGRYAALRGYLATDALSPSGLMGPVELQFADRHELLL